MFENLSIQGLPTEPSVKARADLKRRNLTGLCIGLVAGLAMTMPAWAQPYNDGGGAGSRSVSQGAGAAASGGYVDGGGASRGPVLRHYPRADDGFLRDGGSIRTAPNVQIGPSDEGFLDDGGSISSEPDILIERDDTRRGFLDDGGGIGRDPNVLLGGERGPALRDGGSIRSTPGMRLSGRRPVFLSRGVRPRGPGWRYIDAPPVILRSGGSFTVVTGGDGQNAIITSDVGDRDFRTGSVSYAPRGTTGRRPAVDEPKLIDVSRDRLDRRAPPPGSIQIIAGGGPKIIRIAPDYGRGIDAEERRSE